jgi:hypothetical protein
MSDRYVCLSEDWDNEIQTVTRLNMNENGRRKVFASDVYCCFSEDWDLEMDELQPCDMFKLTFSSWALQVEYEEKQML